MNMRILIALACLATAACSSEGDARRALNGAGYTHIQITGYRLFGCAKSDTFSTGFEAVGPGGARVSGVVCSDWLKGSTIRTD